MLTYHTLSEFFAAADAAHCAPGEIACRQEAEESGKSFEDVWERMKDMIPIFRQSIQEGPFCFMASANAALNSAILVARYPFAPNASASFTKSVRRWGSVLE